MLTQVAGWKEAEFRGAKQALPTLTWVLELLGGQLVEGVSHPLLDHVERDLLPLGVTGSGLLNGSGG